MDLSAELKRHFGFEAFRPGQREVIEAVLAGRDALAVHPTGAGKSLMYQLPAVTRDPGTGVALVVSPLIALMQDQVDGLRRRGIPAAFINSTLSAGERRETWDALAAGGVPLLYAAPEQFEAAGFTERLSQVGCWLLVVDEAHCISQWGHDFRPDYARIGTLLGRLTPRPAVLAVTATATSRVRREIAELLGLRDPLVSLKGIYRPNLRIAIRTDCDSYDRLEGILKVAVWARGGSMIVYAGSRNRAESLASDLVAAGHRAAAYHAGLDAVLRATRQDRFNRGEISIIVATNAFGMGIDKPDIRAVVHWRLPESLEAYYQEIGRAGRDGQTSLCLGFLGAGDVHQLEFMVRQNNPFPSSVESEFRDLLSRTGGQGGPLDWPYDDLPRTEGQAKRIICNFLARFGAVAMDRGQMELDGDWPGLSGPQRRWMDQKRQADMDRVGEVDRLAHEHRCRMLGLQEYFGFADLRAPCGHCDVCQPVKKQPDPRRRVAPSSTSARSDTGVGPPSPRKRGRRKRDLIAEATGGAPPRSPAEFLSDADDLALFEGLRAWRARRANGRPAYTICSDRTLIDLARRRPRTMEQLATIHGIGQTRLATYGRELLDLLRGGGKQS